MSVHEDDGARAAVHLQRDLKRKKNALRKLECKMKPMKENTADFDAAAEECAGLAAEIAKMEAELAASSAPFAASAKEPSGDGRLKTRSVASATKSATPATKCVKMDAGVRDDAASKGTATQQGARDKGQSSASSATEAVLSDAALHEQLTELVAKHIGCDAQVPSFPPTSFQLPQYDWTLVHYQVAELALMMESMLIVGGNARTFAMIEAFKSLLQSTPVLSGSSLYKINPQDFERLINVNFEYLRRSREPSAGMTYVKEGLVRRFVRKLTARVSSGACSSALGSAAVSRKTSLDSPLGGGTSDDIPREVALNVLAFYERELKLSIESILEERSLPFLSSNETILVFGRSSTVEMILLLAARKPELAVKPKVIVVDSAPLYEGRALAKRLTYSGLSVTYGLITTCCTLMPRCTRVFIGASAVLQNGDVLNRCGTAVVVASAKKYRKPVLCFSGSFKFLPEVWLGNLGQNTMCIGMRQPPQGEQRICSPGGWSPSCCPGRDVDGRPFDRVRDFPGMRSDTIPAFGYLYDITPAAYIDMIICEMGCLHTSAIVAAIRDREDKDEYSDMWELRCDVGE